jgi:UDP-N-acetylmuramate dehydrogenase
VLFDEPLARHTTFRIGGPADLFVPAGDLTALAHLTRLAWSYGLPAMVLGGGSNLLVSDAGIRGVVIANQARVMRSSAEELRQNLNGLIPSGLLSQVVVDSGAPLAGLARWAMRSGWSGLEWAISVPGTLGGAVIGNAGAHGGEIADNLAWALVAMPEGGQAVLRPDDLAFAYRSSTLKRRLTLDGPTPVVLAAGFELVRGDLTEMNARADAFLARRRASQPVEPSVGSIFRNPPGDYAGRLVEAAGLKGHRIGGAAVSIRHANFIINTGEARAADVLALIELMRARVFEMAGVELVPEILFAGEWPAHPPYKPLQR